jgi:hypothetical protein
LRCVITRNDHLDPGCVGTGRCHVTANFVLDAFRGEWAAQVGHHDRIAAHPHIGVHIAELNVAKAHKTT